MNNIGFAIWSGVFSGIVTSLIIWLARFVFLKFFQPWYEKSLYKGQNFEGDWQCIRNETLSGGKVVNDRRLVLKLEQKGYKVFGEFMASSKYEKAQNLVEADSSRIDKVLTKLDMQDEYQNDYLVDGFVKGNYLILNYTAKSSKRTGLGSIVSQLVSGGNHLKGSIAFVGENKSEEVTSMEDVIFKRIN